jgi:hypothetical protein
MFRPYLATLIAGLIVLQLWARSVCRQARMVQGNRPSPLSISFHIFTIAYLTAVRTTRQFTHPACRHQCRQMIYRGEQNSATRWIIKLMRDSRLTVGNPEHNHPHHPRDFLSKFQYSNASAFKARPRVGQRKRGDRAATRDLR